MVILSAFFGGLFVLLALFVGPMKKDISYLREGQAKLETEFKEGQNKLETELKELKDIILKKQGS